MAINDFFVWGKGGAKLTPDQIERERQIADALIKQGVDFSPVGHWTQGAARMANALVGNLRQGRADRAQSEGIAGATDAFNNAGIADLLMGGNVPSYSQDASTASALPQQSASDRSIPLSALDAPTSDANKGAFLSAIDRTEGGGSYDTLYGHAQKGGQFGGVRVSQMPISQVLAFSSPSGAYGQSVKNKVGHVATPMGRYQIVGSTLRNAAKEMGLDPNTPFSPEVQDAMATHIAKRAIAGKSDSAAINALRGTWEGFKSVPESQMRSIVGELRGGKVPAVPNSNNQVASADPNFMPQTSSEVTISPVAQALTQPAQAVAAPIQQQAQAAPQSGANLQGLIQLTNNPFLNDAQRGMVNTALQYQMQQNDPVRALQMQQIQQGLRKGDLEIAALQAKPTTKYGFTTLPDGTVVRTNEATGEVLPAYEGAPKPTTTMQELAAAGLQPGTDEYRQAIIDSQRRGTSVTTNVGEQKEDAKFWEGMGTAQAKQFTDMIDTGNVARRNKVNLDRLSQLAAQSPQGLQGAAVNMLANLGIKLDGASNVEAMESLISQLVPSQRPPGSGTISDADLALYKSSLPRIVNSTKGNQLILETLYAINEHDQAAADIADRVANRELTPAQARAELRKIPNPFDNWQEKVKAASQPQPATQQGQGGNKTKSGVTWSVN